MVTISDSKYYQNMNNNINIFYTTSSLDYDHEFEVFNGVLEPHQDSPLRQQSILTSLRENGYRLEAKTYILPESVLHEVHSRDYVTFLKETCLGLTKKDILFPSVFSETLPQSTNTQALLGYYSTDMYTPLHSNTYEAAINSAAVAYSAALSVADQQAPYAYALCRPSGHHASQNKMGGYCFFNNAAIAAQVLSKKGRVAMLDVDFHHGNGTQEIFYDRPDVLTISIHADPAWKFPYYAGFENEKGSKKGLGTNVNVPLSQGTNNEEYHTSLMHAIDKIKQFNPAYLVVPLGFDTYFADPIGGFALTTDYYYRMAQAIHSVKIPTVLVQEGGYNIDMLGKNVVTFLEGFQVEPTV